MAGPVEPGDVRVGDIVVWIYDPKMRRRRVTEVRGHLVTAPLDSPDQRRPRGRSPHYGIEVLVVVERDGERVAEPTLELLASRRDSHTLAAARHNVEA